MKFITTKNETTFAALAHKDFGIHSAKTSAASKHAVATLHAANPHLRNKKKLPAKTLVMVPDALKLHASETQSPAFASADILAQLKQTLAGVRTVVANSSASQTEEAQTSLTLTKDRSLIALIKQAPALRTQLAQIAEQAKMQLAQIDSLQTAQLQGLAQLEKDFADLNLQG